MAFKTTREFPNVTVMKLTFVADFDSFHQIWSCLIHLWPKMAFKMSQEFPTVTVMKLTFVADFGSIHQIWSCLIHLYDIYDPKWHVKCPRNFRPPPQILSCSGDWEPGSLWTTQFRQAFVWLIPPGTGQENNTAQPKQISYLSNSHLSFIIFYHLTVV